MMQVLSSETPAQRTRESHVDSIGVLANNCHACMGACILTCTDEVLLSLYGCMAASCGIPTYFGPGWQVAVAQQDKTGAGGVTRVAVAAPEPEDDLDALLGLL